LPISHELCFIGSVNPKTKRGQLILKLEKEFNMFVGRRYLHEMAIAFSQSKIVLNKSITGDLNMRVFEAMSCEGFLLTDRIGNGLEELFTDRKHLVLYDDLNDAINNINYFLNTPDERTEIALEGKREVQNKHTYSHRVKTLLSHVEGS
jgi:spore maturation protein CgeB